MKRFLLYPTILIFSILLSTPALAQEGQAIDSLFYRGVAAYQQGDFQESLQTMEFLDRVYPGHRRLTASLLMQAKALYRIGETQRAIESYQELKKDFPKSEYADDAQYGLAECYYQLGEYLRAARQLMDVLEKSEDERLQRKAAKMASGVMDNRLRIDELRTLLTDVSGEKSKVAVTIRLAQKEIDRKQFQAAHDVLQSFINQYPKSAYVFQVEELLSRADQLGKGMVKFGVILPLSGPMAQGGNAVLAGIEYAVRKHNAESSIQVELVIRDSGGRVLKAIRATQDLCKNNVIALIGEMSSEISAAVAAVAEANAVPLLMPVASESGLTDIGQNIFQLNANLDIRADVLAEYAVNGLGLRQFAVFGILDDFGEGYGKVMRDAFARTILPQGGEVLMEQWYFTDAVDYGAQFKAIRQFGVEQMIRDSLIVIVPEDMLEETEQKPFVLYTEQTVSELVDSTDLAITPFDGFFMPVYNEALQYIIPQLAFYNIQTQVLGGVPWHDAELLETESRYIDGVIFLSDFYVDPSDFRYYRFRDAYRKETARNPEKLDVFGYDTINLLLSVISKGIYRRDGLREALASTNNYPGIRGTISFNENRINPFISLLQYKGGKISKIR
ncbi:ABC transporter substrate-binding protein [candidate division KSB1 bacterium]|nr:ABC transporter substrate-binding protein [candidate division KSB1 bacterium]